MHVFRSLAPNFYDMEERPTVKKERNFSETEIETRVTGGCEPSGFVW